MKIICKIFTIFYTEFSLTKQRTNSILSNERRFPHAWNSLFVSFNFNNIIFIENLKAPLSKLEEFTQIRKFVTSTFTFRQWIPLRYLICKFHLKVPIRPLHNVVHCSILLRILFYGEFVSRFSNASSQYTDLC